MTLGAWLAVCVILVWLLFHHIGRAVLLTCVVLLAFAVLIGCEKQVVLECNVAGVLGTFQTTQRELDRPHGRHVRMYRDERVFLWPADQVTACRGL